MENKIIQEQVEHPDVAKLLQILKDEDFGNKDQRLRMIDLLTTLITIKDVDVRRIFKKLGNFFTEIGEEMLEDRKVQRYESVFNETSTLIYKYAKNMYNDLKHIALSRPMGFGGRDISIKFKNNGEDEIIDYIEGLGFVYDRHDNIYVNKKINISIKINISPVYIHIRFYEG